MQMYRVIISASDSSGLPNLKKETHEALKIPSELDPGIGLRQSGRIQGPLKYKFRKMPNDLISRGSIKS